MRIVTRAWNAATNREQVSSFILPGVQRGERPAIRHPCKLCRRAIPNQLNIGKLGFKGFRIEGFGSRGGNPPEPGITASIVPSFGLAMFGLLHMVWWMGQQRAKKLKWDVTWTSASKVKYEKLESLLRHYSETRRQRSRSKFKIKTSVQ